MKREYEVTFSCSTSQYDYVSKWLRVFTKRLIDAYVETKQLIDPKYKFNFDCSPHDMLLYIPHDDMKYELKLLINIYRLEYKSCINFIYSCIVDTLTFYQSLLYFFNGGVGSYCPSEFPDVKHSLFRDI